jgi:hypothetical protein
LNTPQSVPELHTVASEDPTVVAGLTAGSRPVSDASVTADLVNSDTASLRALLPEPERAVLALRDLNGPLGETVERVCLKVSEPC